MAKMTPEQLKNGQSNAIRWTGSLKLPEFLELCEKPAGNSGIPEQRVAYLEAMNHAHEWQSYQFSHPCVLAALRASNVTAIRSMPEKSSSVIFYRNYKVVCNKFQAGLPIDDKIPEALPEKIEHRLTEEDTRARVKALRARTGV